MFGQVAPSISSYGGDIDGVIHFIWWVVFGWFLAAQGLLVFFLIRYRRKEGKRAAWLPGNTWRATSWVLIPAFVVLVFDLWIEARSAGAWHKVVEDVPEEGMMVRVTARQFAWSFQYAGQDNVLDSEDDFTTVNELHVPQGEVVRIQLESVDVLHSFWVPALRYKQDVVPGRSIPGWFDANVAGKYEIACAELCGPSHSAMRAVLTVEPPAVFWAWAALQTEQQALARSVNKP